jgi:hypothetical protein
MAIQINGNGTITGISAGGLPAGTVTSATLASGVGGKVLQVVTGSATSETSQGFSTNAFADTGLSASITPSATSSKILVTGYLCWYADQSANGNIEFNFAICDGSNNILDSTTANNRGYRFNENYETGGRHPICFLHSPNTTSSFTYKMRMNAQNTGHSANLYCQVNGTANNISRLTLMEIAA